MTWPEASNSLIWLNKHDLSPAALYFGIKRER